jgi:hypothetical protein
MRIVQQFRESSVGMRKRIKQFAVRQIVCHPSSLNAKSAVFEHLLL